MNTELSIAGTALWPDGRFAEATLHLAGGVIERMDPGIDPAADLHSTGPIVPGLIDLQVNGAFGYDLTFDAHRLPEVAAGLPATGVTAFVPTIITSDWGTYPQRLAEIAAAQFRPGSARSLGVHLEGPFLNPQRKGAHNPAYLRSINPGEIAEWADPEQVAIVTLAPELPHALEAIRLLRRQGVRVVSAGHSNATYEQALAAFEAGIGWGTHLFNAMVSFQHREPGLPGALLASDVPCGLIPDGIHVHPAAVKLAYQAKGARGITLVTDCMEAMGMPPGRYKLDALEVIVTETDARLPNGTLAGSILTMDAGVRNMMQFSGCSLAEAVQMASTTPANLLGLGDRLGRLQPGCLADILLLDADLRPEVTIIGGEIAFQRAK